MAQTKDICQEIPSKTGSNGKKSRLCGITYRKKQYICKRKSYCLSPGSTHCELSAISNRIINLNIKHIIL